MIPMLKIAARPSSRSLIVRCLVGALLVLVYIYYFPVRGDGRDRSKSGWNPTGGHDDVCDAFSGLERVVITIKTGATESIQKIPTQLRTSLRCAPHVYVFSDMAQQIGETQVFDALDTIPAKVMDGNTDFDIYRKQRELGDPEKIASVLKDFKDPQRPEDLAAWTLDKYKNNHIVEKAWALQPDMDWYLHIDADTYVIWSSLIAWLQKLDPSKESFYGSLSSIVGKPFAHGGSGLLLSNAATRNFVNTHNGTAAKWDYEMQNNCCGDWVLAQILHDYGMDVLHSWPTLQGETPDTIPFASDHWCQPLVTLHHITPAEAERLGQFESRRHNKSAPVLYSEVYEDMISNTFSDYLEDWDNKSNNEEVSGVTTPENCVQACADNPSCFQSLYNGDACFVDTKLFRLGEMHKPVDGKKWYSSWNRTRIATWVSAQKPCRKIEFPFEAKV